MQEFFIMIGLSALLAVAAFAEPARSNLTSVPRAAHQQVLVVPESGTATFVFTGTSTSTSSNINSTNAPKLPRGVGTSIPVRPPTMPPEPAKPTGFR